MNKSSSCLVSLHLQRSGYHAADRATWLCIHWATHFEFDCSMKCNYHFDGSTKKNLKTFSKEKKSFGGNRLMIRQSLVDSKGAMRCADPACRLKQDMEAWVDSRRFYDVNFERFSTIGQLYSFIRVEVAGVLFLLPPFLITFISNGTPDVFIWFLFVFAFFLNVLGSLLRTA